MRGAGKKPLCLSLCDPHYRLDADVGFFPVGALHLIHYPGAAKEIAKSGSIHRGVFGGAAVGVERGHDRACCSAELPVT